MAQYPTAEVDPRAEADLAAHIAVQPAHGGDLAGTPRPAIAHVHPIAEVTGLQAALDDKAATAYVDTQIANVGITIGALTAADVGALPDTTPVVLTDDARLTDSRTPIGAAGGDLTGAYPNPQVSSTFVSPTAVTLTPGSTARNVVQPTLVTVVPLIAKGTAAQTADLQQWQSSAGIVLLAVNPTGSVVGYDSSGVAKYVIDGGPGYFRGSGFTNFANTGGYLNIGSNLTDVPMFIQRTASAVALAVRGAVSQSTNLQEWQASGGTPLAYVSSTGSLYTGDRLAVAGAWLSSVRASLYTGAASWKGLVVQGVAGQTANTQEWQDSTGAVKTAIGPAGDRVLTSFIRSPDNAGGYISFTNSPGAAMAVPAVASSVGFIVQGRPSQTGDLQQWQDSTGTTKSSVNPLGYFRIGGAEFNVGAAINIQTAAGTSPSVGMRNSATHQWHFGGWDTQDRFGITKTGVADVALFSNVAGEPSLIVQAITATKSGLVVKGVAAQSSNLQEWQTSASSTLSSVGSNGWINAPRFLASAVSGSGALEATVTGEAVSRVKVTNTSLLMGGGALTQDAQIDRPSPGVMRLQGIGGATGTTWAVRALAGQAGANLQEWQDSTGATLARVSGSGNFGVGGKALEVWSTGFSTFIGSVGFGTPGVGTAVLTMTGASGRPPSFVAGSTTTQALVVIAAASQTANLQEWQDSTGAAKASMTAAGNLTVASLSSLGSVGLTTNNNLFFGSSLITQAAGGSLAARAIDGNGNMVFSANNSVYFVADRLNTQTTQKIFFAHDSEGSTATLMVIQEDGTVGIGTGASSIAGAQLAAVSTVASTKPLIARGAASQTANLQEWQTSTGVVVGGVSPVGHVGVGTAPTSLTALWVNKDFGTAPADQSMGTKVGVSLSPAAAFNGAYGGVNQISMSAAATFTSGYAYGLFNQAYFTGGGGTLTQLAGLYCRTALGGTSPTGTVTNAQALYIDPLANQAGGAPAVTVTNQYGIMVANQGSGSGTNGLTITNAYGIYVQNTAGASSLNYAIFTAGGMVRHDAGAAANTPLYLKGAPSQTGDLTQWADSAGNVVHRVNPAGQLGIRAAAAPAALAGYGYVYVDAGGALRYRGPTTDSLLAVA